MVARIRVLLILIILAWLGIIARLFYWQVYSFPRLYSQAGQQHLSRQEIPSSRGKIFSSDGFSLVLSKPVNQLYLEPNRVEDPQKTFELISQVVDLDSKTFFKVVENKKIFWYPLASKIDNQTKEKLISEKIQGIGFDPQWTRSYPEASMAAQLLGFVGSDENGNEQGYFGIEGYYDRELKGISGLRFLETDLLGRHILIGKQWGKSPKQGRDLHLFLDRAIQLAVEKRLKEGLEKYGALAGSVVVMDPWTGAVLAMACLPTFDQADFATEDKTHFPNPIISSTFEPGSVFKPVVMAMAIDLGLVNQNTVCEICTGPISVGEHTISTWNDKYYPKSTMTEVIQHSDNVGMVFVAQKLGNKNFSQYLERLGFRGKTGIDLEGETQPILKKEDQWLAIDLATAGFGQGVAFTQMQIIRGISAIANGGSLITPRVVEKISEGEKEIFVEIKKQSVIKPITAKVVTQMMVNAVEKGEAKWAKPPGYKIAGKTGTAQIPVAGHYDQDRTIASFVGFAPSDDPKFVMLITLQEPQTSPWGSETAAPLWFKTALDIFQILGIPPS